MQNFTMQELLLNHILGVQVGGDSSSQSSDSGDIMISSDSDDSNQMPPAFAEQKNNDQSSVVSEIVPGHQYSFLPFAGVISTKFYEAMCF